MTRAELFSAVRPFAPDQRFPPEDVAVIDSLADKWGIPRIGEAAPAPTKGDAFTALAVKHLRFEEGVVPNAYQDHLGFWTIGVGRLIDKRKGGRLTNAEIDMLLANDIAEKAASMAGWPAWERVKGDPVRATALLSMCFQLGTQGLAGFKNTLALIAAGRFPEAATNMLASKWAEQTPARAKRVAAMLRTGKVA
jgi:lysozyme